MSAHAAVRFELHILVKKGSTYTKTEMKKLARSWANGEALPKDVQIKAVAWRHGKRVTKGTPALIREYRERFAGLLHAGTMAVRAKNRKD